MLSFRVIVRYHLDPSWIDSSAGSFITHTFDGDEPVSVLTCQVADQGALMAFLSDLQGLALQIRSVERVDSSNSPE